MSFMKSLKGLADDFKGLMSDKDKDKPKDEHKQAATQGESNRGASDSYYQQQSSQPAYGQSNYPPHQQSYGGGPPGQQPQYGGPPGQQQHQYGGPPPPQGYGAPPSGPQLPPGWIQQWDQNSQKYYYLEQSTGRTQWEPPAHLPPSGDQSRGYGAPPPGQGYPGHGPGFPSSAMSHPGGPHFPMEAARSGEVNKDKSNKKMLLAAGVGGLAVGGLAGAALAGDDSDDEHHHAAAGGYGAAPAGYGAPPAGYGYGAPPASDPQALEHNSDVSSSQRESLEEARHDYEEAQREAADSDASSSDREEAREAREEYQEEIEEAEEEAYDD